VLSVGAGVVVSVGAGVLSVGAGAGVLSTGAGAGVVSTGAGAGVVSTGAGAGVVSTGAGAGVVSTGAGAGVVSTGAGAGAVAVGSGAGTLAVGSGVLTVGSGALTVGSGVLTVGSGELTVGSVLLAVGSEGELSVLSAGALAVASAPPPLSPPPESSAHAGAVKAGAIMTAITATSADSHRLTCRCLLTGLWSFGRIGRTAPCRSGRANWSQRGGRGTTASRTTERPAHVRRQPRDRGNDGRRRPVGPSVGSRRLHPAVCDPSHSGAAHTLGYRKVTTLWRPGRAKRDESYALSARKLISRALRSAPGGALAAPPRSAFAPHR
jgi:hypothetical protein